MRLWSLHPRYLDQAGLVACWREGLLAKKVLEGKTKGYKNHPQLNRFKNYSFPLKAINSYLYYIYEGAVKRGYNFDKTKIRNYGLKRVIAVTKGQLEYEFNHLSKKLRERDFTKYEEIQKHKIQTNPIFRIVPGKVEPWEKI